MLDTNGDLISRSLGYYSESNKDDNHGNYVRNDDEKHVPVLDVWVRPFNLDEISVLFKEAESPDNNSDDMDVTITHITVIPDPIPLEGK